MNDVDFLKLALHEAGKRRGYTAPNPAVGAVVVKDGRLIGCAAHPGAGSLHAEALALAPLGDEARGATIYVTLEPCCHFGRTPPCSKLLVERKLARVVYGFRDPDPRVRGGGHAECEAAGLEVQQLRLSEIDAFYESYAHWARTGLPFVTAKLALSLDGKIAGPGGTRVQLTGEQASLLTHELRHRADAILTTGKTLRTDDPSLNVRLAQPAFQKPVYVLDARAELPLSLRIFQTARRLVVFHAPGVSTERLGALAARGATPMEIAAPAGRLSLEAALKQIARDGAHDLWVEAGGTLFEALAAGNHLQRAYLYVAPRWLGPSGQPAFGSAGWLESATRVFWKGEGRDAVARVEWERTCSPE